MLFYTRYKYLRQRETTINTALDNDITLTFYKKLQKPIFNPYIQYANFTKTSSHAQQKRI